MIKLGTHIPNMDDSTSFYRAMGPLAELRRTMPELHCHHLAKYTPMTVSECDAMFLQRPYSDSDVGIMQMCQDVGVPTWIDFDDLLMAMPTDNPAYFQYMSEKSLANMRFLIENADHITVSTFELKQTLQKKNPNVSMVRNAINMRNFPWREKPPARKKRVVWRGSRTHHRDVFTYAQTLLEASKKHEDFEWHFIGDNLWFLTDNMPHARTFVSPPVEWTKYFRQIYDLAPSLMIVPLHEHPFNWCKSNIAWIEGAFAGAPTLAPDWEEWKRPGVINYKNESDMQTKLNGILSGQYDLEGLAKDGWKYIEAHLQLTKVNKIRENVLRSLCES